MGVGTGGTLVGVGQAFREANPDVKLFAVEPDESCTILCSEGEKYISDHFRKPEGGEMQRSSCGPSW
jgi:cysteine synthase